VNSNISELESDASESELTFAKEQLGGTPTSKDCKLLGLGWDKHTDSLQVTFPTIPAVLTKRGVLAYLANVYDPLGVVSPVLLYRETCDSKIRWDAPLPEPLAKR
jgi:hypothetical protein